MHTAIHCNILMYCNKILDLDSATVPVLSVTHRNDVWLYYQSSSVHDTRHHTDDTSYSLCSKEHKNLSTVEKQNQWGNTSISIHTSVFKSTSSPAMRMLHVLGTAPRMYHKIHIWDSERWDLFSSWTAQGTKKKLKRHVLIFKHTDSLSNESTEYMYVI